MSSLKVVNIKCGGCEQGIINALKRAGLENTTVNVPEQIVSFDGDKKVASQVLNRLGYPKADSHEAKSLVKKGKSYVSCMIGRFSK